MPIEPRSFVSMRPRRNRRDFLKSSAAAGAGFWVSGVAAAEDSKSPNERVRFTCIGVDGKGTSESNDAGKRSDSVASSDIEEKALDKASKRFPGAKRYNDFRKMLDEVGKNIDAVTVSTPDHTHAPASALAMRMGKACF